MFLRHAPDYYVRLGAASWFDKEGFGYWADNEALRLQICLNKRLYEFMEPVLIDIKLENIQKSLIEVPDNILSSNTYVSVIIQKKGAEPIMYERLVHECDNHHKTVLEGCGGKDNYLLETMNLSVGHAGWYITEPGEYTINAAVFYEDKVLIAKPVSIMIRLPAHWYEDRIAQDHFSMDTAKVLY